MNSGSILLVVASKGYQHSECSIPKKILENAGFSVVIASDKMPQAVADNGSVIQVNIELSLVNVKNYAGIFFIGGSGALEHLDNKTSYEIVQKAASHAIPIGAICIATRILAKAGVLTGHQATGWNGDGLLGNVYQTHNVHYMNQDVVVDDNIITATGPDAAHEFGEQIILLLQGSKSWE